MFTRIVDLLRENVTLNNPLHGLLVYWIRHVRISACITYEFGQIGAQQIIFCLSRALSRVLREALS